MLGFDHELRRNGFAGNACQMVLELDAAVDPDTLRERVRRMLDRYPILSARLRGGFRPAWKPMRDAARLLSVHEHRDEPGLARELFNEPLRMRQGELMRFDLLQRQDGGTTLCFLWTHALMDAPGAEHFLALIGRDDLDPAAAPNPDLPPPRKSLLHRFREARKNLFQIDEFCKASPRSMGSRVAGAARRMNYRVETFTREETDRVLALATQHCGTLGTARYHAAVALVELHRLQERLGPSSPSYILPVPVGLRSKGTIEPLFRNQVTMLMTQLFPEHVQSVPKAVARLKAQTEQGLRRGLIEGGLALSDLFRFLPLPVFMAILKRGMHGEICSLFYGDTAAVSPLLTQFLGTSINTLTHVAAVTPSPGLGVIFYTFRGLLRITVLNLSNVLSETEAAGFAADLRARLLNP